MKLKEATKKVENGIERLNQEICRRTRVEGQLSCPHTSLCPAAPCNRHTVGQQEVYEHEALNFYYFCKISPSLIVIIREA